MKNQTIKIDVDDILQDIIATAHEVKEQEVDEKRQQEVEDTIEQLSRGWDLKVAEANVAPVKTTQSGIPLDNKPFHNPDEIATFVLNGTVSGPYAKPYLEWFFDVSEEDAFNMAWDWDYNKQKFPMFVQQRGLQKYYNGLNYWNKILTTAMAFKRKKFAQERELVALAHKKYRDCLGKINSINVQVEKYELKKQEQEIRDKMRKARFGV